MTPYMLQRQQMKLTGVKPQQEKKAVKMNHGQWFDAQLDQAAKIGKCECCGDDLAPSMVINPRSVIAHILPKSKFPAVATASQNRAFLCSSCHATYDAASSSEIAELTIYHILVERLKSFYNLITEVEKKSLPDCFRIDAPGFVMPY